MQKLGQASAWPSSRDLLLNFGIPLYLWYGIVRHFKFRAHIGRQV